MKVSANKNRLEVVFSYKDKGVFNECVRRCKSIGLMWSTRGDCWFGSLAKLPAVREQFPKAIYDEQVDSAFEEEMKQRALDFAFTLAANGVSLSMDGSEIVASGRYVTSGIKETIRELYPWLRAIVEIPAGERKSLYSQSRLF